jgi:hypothetical protein
MRYGDTPTGGYRLSRLLPTGDGTSYPADEFGSSGALVLDALSGDAALAEASGRFQFFLQAGASGSAKSLRSTNGNLRIGQKDLQSVVRAIGTKLPIACEIIESAALTQTQLVHVDPDYDQGDPPLRPEIIRPKGELPVSRRQFIRTATATAAGVAIGGVSFLASQPARANTVSQYNYDRSSGSVSSQNSGAAEDSVSSAPSPESADQSRISTADTQIRSNGPARQYEFDPPSEDVMQ